MISFRYIIGSILIDFLVNKNYNKECLHLLKNMRLTYAF